MGLEIGNLTPPLPLTFTQILMWWLRSFHLPRCDVRLSTSAFASSSPKEFRQHLKEAVDFFFLVSFIAGPGFVPPGSGTPPPPPMRWFAMPGQPFLGPQFPRARFVSTLERVATVASQIGVPLPSPCP